MTSASHPRRATDREYLARRERLLSEVGQSLGEPPDARVVALQKQLESLSEGHPKDQDVLTIQRVEAELCLFKPKTLLYPTYVRLKSNFYRFDKDRREAWQADLKRLLPDAKTIVDEDWLRQRLRQLTFELYEEAEAYNRLTRQRSRVIQSLMITSIWILLALLATLALATLIQIMGHVAWLSWVVPTCLAGAIGAMVSIISSMSKEKPRDDFLSTLQWQMVARGMLGLVYALVVYWGVKSGIVPLAIPSDADGHSAAAFFLALGFVSGFSDKLFGQTVSQFITKGSSASAKSGDS